MKNGHTLMLFKDIFQIYQSISNKVVGILARARKNRLVHFEGETLFQGTSDDTNVTLLRSAADIENHFKATKVDFIFRNCKHRCKVKCKIQKKL